MSSTTASVSKILASSADWEAWEKDFMSQAIGHNLLDFIRGKQRLLTIPDEPNMEDYPQKRSVSNRSRQPTETIVAATATAAIPTAAGTANESSEQTAIPTPEDAETPGESTVQYSDLTVEG